jgi:hypothetical protein
LVTNVVDVPNKPHPGAAMLRGVLLSIVFNLSGPATTVSLAKP